MDAVRDRLSPHQVGVADLLDSARLIECYPASVTLLDLVPETIELSVERTASVESGLDALVEAVVREVQSLGYTMRREGEDDDPPHAMRDLAHHFGM